jgi:hypothetical protein
MGAQWVAGMLLHIPKIGVAFIFGGGCLLPTLEKPGFLRVVEDFWQNGDYLFCR